MKKLSSLIVLLLIVACASGCNDNNPSTPNTGNGGGSTPPPNNQPGAAAMLITIPMGAATLGTAAFQPNPAQIQPGMTVTWMNHDSMTHTATSDVGRFDSGNIAPGQSFSWVVPQDINTSRIDYHCEIHPSMRGSLSLQAAGASPSPSPSPSPMPSSGGTGGTGGGGY